MFPLNRSQQVWWGDSPEVMQVALPVVPSMAQLRGCPQVRCSRNHRQRGRSSRAGQGQTPSAPGRGYASCEQHPFSSPKLREPMSIQSKIASTAAKYGRRGVTVTQTLPDWRRHKAYRRKTAAFEEWRKKLNHADRLPRGRFFKGKKPGRTFVVIDEFWQALS